MQATTQGFRLSPYQRRQWLAGWNGSDFMALGVVELEGVLDLDALRGAVRRVIGQHDILRTTFQSRPGLRVPLQVVEESCEFEWRELDLNGKSGAWIEALLAACARLPWVPEESPRLRCIVARESPERHGLLLGLPCLCADARSLASLVDEIARAYRAIRAGVDSDPGDVVQYIHVSEWQNDLLAEGGAEVAKGKGFWQARAELPEIVLPCERRARGGRGQGVCSIDRKIEAVLWSRLREASRSADAPLQAFLLACWSMLLRRLAGQGELALGYVVDGRRYEELQDVLGPLAIALPLPLELQEGQPFHSVLKGAEAAVLEAVRWQEYLYAEDWWRGRESSSAIGFEFQERVSPREEAGVVFSLLRRYVRSEPWKLKLCCAEGADCLSLSLQYDPALFGEEDVRHLLDQLEAVAASASRDLETPIATLEILGEEERRRLLFDFNRTAVPRPAELSTHGLFTEHARETPDRVAVVDEDHRLTFGELEARASRLAHHLCHLGAGPDAVVGLALERSAEVVVGILGTWKAGAAYLPLDVAQPAERLASLLEESRAVAVVLREPRLDWLPRGGARAVWIDRRGEVSGRVLDGHPPVPALPENLAYVIFTSGSTGRPKGVAVEHRSLASYVVGILERLSLPAGSSFATVSSFAADLGNTTVFASLCSGGSLHVVSEERVADAAAMAEYMEWHGIDCLKIVPSHLEALAGAGVARVLPRQRLVLGGEASRRDWVERLGAGCGCQILNHYGPTETTVGVLTCDATEALGDPLPSTVPLGRPLPNSRVYVLDRWLAPVPVWVSGELYVAGAGLARGYLGRPDLTAERFLPDPWSVEPGARMYGTGDLARHRPEGVIEFLGRDDDQVKLRGYRIEPGEVEAALRRHPEVAQAAVVAREDEPGDKRLVAYVVPREMDRFSAPELRSFVGAILPSYMVPASFVALRSLPLTRNGKLDRRALPPPEKGSSDGAQESAAPRNPFEELLAGIWAGSLRVGRVGVEDNFFDLGGHSLLATRVISRIREAFGVTLPVRALFDRPTVSGLAESIVEAMKGRQGEASSAPPLKATAREGALPLSFAQQRLWFLDQLAPGSTVYNVPHAVVLTGALHLPALARSVAEIVRRHEVLRTTYEVVDGEPAARIGPWEAPAVPVVDLRGLGAAATEETRRLARAEARRSFDLQRGPLLRLLVVQLGEASHALLSTMHHIVSDGWSSGILIRELSVLYGAYLAGRASPLPELPIQYADFAAWQRRWLSGEVLASQLAYWKEQLAGVPPVLDLPTDRPRRAVHRGRGARELFALPGESLEGLRRLVREQESTLFMGLLAAFVALLERHTGQEDMAVGTPIAGRTRVETERLIGFFVNTLVLRAELSADPSFEDQLKRLREVALGAYAHQELPFEQLVEELEPVRDLSRTPLFQVMFVLQNLPLEALDIEGLRLASLELENDTAKFDLTLSMVERGGGVGGMSGVIEYDADLFDRSTVCRMVEHLRTLLLGALAAPHTALSSLALLGAGERHQVLTEWNDTEFSYGEWQPLHRLVEAQVERAPDRVAVVFEGQHLTYGELNVWANRLARRLRRLGVRPGAAVAICAERSLDLVIGLLGILKAGAAYVPLDPGYPPERLRFILRDPLHGVARPVLLVQEYLADVLTTGDPASEGMTVVRLEAARAASALEAASDLSIALSPEDLAYVIYTSGSTGRPKGVMNSHRGIVNRLLWMQQELQITEADRVLQKTPFSFDVSVWELFWPLLTRACLVVARPEGHKDSAYLALTVEEQEITVLHFVPSMLSAFLDEPELGRCASLRRVVASGEALPYELTWRFLTRFSASLHNLYGPTEAAVDVTHHTCGVSPSGLVPIGRPIANLEIHVVGWSLELVPLGSTGELWIGGIGLARGYLGRGDLTARAFVPHPWSDRPGERLYRTGDLVRRLANGSLCYLGRIDHQVKIRGFRIELGEVESALLAHPGVREAVVVAREARPEQGRLIAYVVPANGRLSGETLRGFLRERLPEPMVPAVFLCLDALPLTANGKVDRRALPSPEERAGAGAAEPAAARTPFEELLEGIWAEALKLERVGAEDNFFDLGGHSLLATRVVSRIRETFGVTLPVRMLFDRPTVEQLGAEIVSALKDEAAVSAAPPLEAVSREGLLPLSFSQRRLWFVDQLEPGTAAYNLPFAVRIEGTLAPSLLAQALARVVERHEVLRTTFVAVDGEPFQVIAPAVAVHLPLIDLAGLGEPHRQAETAELAAREAAVPFDLARGPLLRLKLLRLADDDQLLLLTTHHVVADGESLELLIDEAARFYLALSRGERSSLCELPLQYADYATWQRKWLQGEVLERELAYWRQQLAGERSPLQLPMDHRPPVKRTHRGKRYPFQLPSSLSAAIRALCAQEASTSFMFALAALSLLLSRYAREEDVVVGVDLSSRPHRETAGLIGFFINMLVLRTDLSGDPSFRELMRRVRETSLEALTHQEMPYERLVEELRPERMPSGTPLFQVALNFTSARRQKAVEFLESAGLRLSAVEREEQLVRFDLMLRLNEADGRLGGSWVYSTELFEPATILRLHERFMTLIGKVVERPEATLSEIETEVATHELAEQEEPWLQAAWQHVRATEPTKIRLQAEPIRG